MLLKEIIGTIADNLDVWGDTPDSAFKTGRVDEVEPILLL